MTDRELIELAAKAAGLRLAWKDGISYIGLGSYMPRHWNPITSDVDAFRLAVKLGLEIRRDRWPSGTRYVSAHRVWNSNDSCYEDDGIPVDPDPYVATRLAITRAAAEIGKRVN